MLKVFIYVLSMFCSGNTFLEIKIVCRVNLCHSASKSSEKKGSVNIIYMEMLICWIFPQVRIPIVPNQRPAISASSSTPVSTHTHNMAQLFLHLSLTPHTCFRLTFFVSPASFSIDTHQSNCVSSFKIFGYGLSKTNICSLNIFDDSRREGELGTLSL